MFTFTDDIADLTETFADPSEHREAVSQLRDCGYPVDAAWRDLADPAALARAIVRCFGTYEISKS